MKRIFSILFLAFFFAACTCGGEEIVIPPEEYHHAPPEEYNQLPEEVPPVEIPPEEYPPPEQPAEAAIPEHDEHRVFLEFDPDGRTVSGSSHTTFTNRTGAELETIVLRVYLNAFGEDTEPVFTEMEWRAFPDGRDYGGMEILYAFIDDEPLDFEIDETILTLIPEEPLQPYETVRLFLLYDAQIPQIAHRTGANDYAMWMGMFLPVLAVYENGWNTDAHYPAGSPFFTGLANYRVDITTPSRYTVVGTGVRTEEVIGDTDIKITHFTAYRARDFAFALSPYFLSAHTETESGVDIHLYYYTETLDAEEILDAARRSMEYFETRMGAFPLGHVTIVEAELVQDSMSFSQVIFVDSWYLSRGGRYWAVAHALGNQWLAHIIGTNRATEPWLTNGLTRFLQTGIFYHDPIALRSRMERDYLSINDGSTLVIANGLGASTTHAHYVQTHGRKAMLMTYALHERIGEELFWQIIAEYYQRHAFETATTADFIEIAEEISGQNLENFFNRWLNQGTVPGLP